MSGHRTGSVAHPANITIQYGPREGLYISQQRWSIRCRKSTLDYGRQLQYIISHMYSIVGVQFKHSKWSKVREDGSKILKLNGYHFLYSYYQK